MQRRIYLGPMAGVTDAAFRQLCIEQGADLTYTEMVSAKGLKYGSAKTGALLHLAENERQIGVQLFASDPAVLRQSIEMLSESHGSRIAVFDINMGCPAPKITGNGEGCALMKNPALAERLIKTAVSVSHVPVTVKFRKGWDDNSCNAVDFARMAEQAGASAVAVHGRTRDQFYSGRSDAGIIAAVKCAVSIPVIGNGDIFSAEDAAAMFASTGCDAVMVARGALGNPFLFREIRHYLDTNSKLPKASPKEKAAKLFLQAQLCCGYKGERLAMRQMRKHAAWYFKGMHGAAKLREAAVRIETLAELEHLIGTLCNSEETKKVFLPDAMPVEKC